MGWMGLASAGGDIEIPLGLPGSYVLSAWQTQITNLH